MLNRTRSNCLMKCTGEPDNEDDDHLTYEKVNTGRSIRQSTLRWCEGTRQQQHQSKIRPKTSLWPACRKSQMPAKVVGTLGVSHRSPQPKPSKVYIYIITCIYSSSQKEHQNDHRPLVLCVDRKRNVGILRRYLANMGGES